MTIGLPPELNIPPPSPPMKVRFPLNVQWVTVGLPPELNIPPPPVESAPMVLPPVIVNPSMIAVASVPLPVVT
jgi:hypothetical protein